MSSLLLCRDVCAKKSLNSLDTVYDDIDATCNMSHVARHMSHVAQSFAREHVYGEKRVASIELHIAYSIFHVVLCAQYDARQVIVGIFSENPCERGDGE